VRIDRLVRLVHTKTNDNNYSYIYNRYRRFTGFSRHFNIVRFAWVIPLIYVKSINIRFLYKNIYNPMRNIVISRTCLLYGYNLIRMCTCTSLNISVYIVLVISVLYQVDFIVMYYGYLVCVLFYFTSSTLI